MSSMLDMDGDDKKGVALGNHTRTQVASQNVTVTRRVTFIAISLFSTYHPMTTSRALFFP
jgi:hypothetical protein